jgi:sugar phosphate isomerase/epimerase
MTTPAASPKGLRLGSTLYSFTNAFHSRQYSFEQLLAKVAELGIGPGVEVVGYQSIRGFPQVSDAFAARFRALLAQYRLEPSCFSINADMALRRGTTMSIDEAVAYHVPQIEAAAKLGFPVVRCQFAAPAEVLRRLVPLAERLGIKMGPEVHAPMTVNSPAVLAYREMYAKANSPSLGFVPDFGASAFGIPASYLAILRDRGVPGDLVAIATRIWKTPDDAASKRDAFMREAGRADPAHLSAVAVIFNILSPQDPSAWLEIMPQVIHIHGKFYDFDAAGNETSIPYDRLLPVFIDGGYNGFISSEWEGHMFSGASGFDEVQKHHALCRRIIASHRSPARTALA